MVIWAAFSSRVIFESISSALEYSSDSEVPVSDVSGTGGVSEGVLGSSEETDETEAGGISETEVPESTLILSVPLTAHPHKPSDSIMAKAGNIFFIKPDPPMPLRLPADR